MFARAMHSGSHPILAQIIPIRRCNLDCAYCNEYDKTSAPVPLPAMLRRIDRLATWADRSSPSAAASRRCIRIWIRSFVTYGAAGPWPR